MEKFEKVSIERNKKLNEIKVPNDVNIIGSVARLEKQKDIPTLLRAFNLVAEAGHKTHLLIVGHGSEEVSIKKLAISLGLDHKVTFLKKRTDVAELLAIMDIFVLPSLKEGMSNGLLEAMASERMIIASDIPENKELIKGGFNGLTFCAGNFRDLYEKIIFCIKKDKKQLEHFRQAASLIIRKEYGIHEIAKKFSDFLIGA
jgi:glycosyltransferase involved in cell wall biosynthesis